MQHSASSIALAERCERAWWLRYRGKLKPPELTWKQVKRMRARGERLPAGAFSKALGKCDNKICINPEHLYWGTNAQNMRDKSERGLQPTKLSPGEVEKIRAAYARAPSLPPLARHYRVHVVTIFDIVRRRTWKHLP